MKKDAAASTPLAETLASVGNLRHRTYRQKTGCFWIERVRNFIHAYDAQYQFESIVYSPILLKHDVAEMLSRRLKQRGIPRLTVTPETFRQLSRTPAASGLGAIVRQRWTVLDDIHPAPRSCWLIVEEIRSRGNLGTMLRTAEATGASGVIFVESPCEPYHPQVVRASMGSIYRLQFAQATFSEFQTWSVAHQIRVVGLTPAGQTIWPQTASQAPVALVIGEERRGLTERMVCWCDELVRLPMRGRVDSLNVGVATSVMLYAWWRSTVPDDWSTQPQSPMPRDPSTKSNPCRHR